MATQNLSKIFQPKSIAIVGATSREHSVGRTLLENHQRAGFEGEVYAVNPQHESVLGVACYPSVRELPTVVDLAIIATPAATVSEIVRGCGESGIPGVIIVSAGFREVGAAGKALEDQLAAEIAKFPAMRVVGPNCLGVLVPASRLNASFATAMPENGRIAFVSQSGALCTSILDWSLSERIGFSHFVSIGNSLDVKFGDLIDYFAEDESTDSIVLYIESITEARRFMSAARAFTRTKPIVVYKAGRFAQSAQAAASHTGAMAGVDAVYEAAFQRAGIVRVYDAEEMFDCAELLARHQPPEGPRLAIVTNAGGPGVMATDALLQCGGELAELSPQTLAALDEVLPPHWSHNNPVDVLGDALPERYRRAVELVLNDNHVDAVLATLSPQTMTEPTQTAELLAGVAAKTRKPVLAVWMGGQSVAAGRELMNRAGVATFDSPDRAVRAFTYLYSYKRNREILYETPRQVPLDKWLDERAAHERLTGYLTEGRATLTETESKALLADYGVLSTTPLPARTSLEAIKIARQIGYPVVMKVHSPQILHKTEVHGVVTGVSSDERTSRVFREIVTRARQMRPTAEVEGVTIQPMISSAEGIELIVGAKRDPVFGAVIMVGAGGVTAEVLKDRALELPPLNERLARRMLESLKIRPLLEGFRGRGPVHLNRLIETLMRISYLIADNPEILELDVNPLLVTPDGVTALDARVILDPKARLQKLRPYSHLAIRPYPDEYVSYKTLRDGANILLRPVRPEDEPLWLDFLSRCSERSLWLRFRYLFKESSHELATRFCFIDYDRTMAIVAEVDDGSERQIVGVGRLVADADHREAEYAVLVSDEWQGRGLGSLLTDYCLEICQSWGISRVVAETTVENDRMKHLLLNREFDRRHCGDSREVLYEKQFRNVPAPAGAELVRAGNASTGVGLSG